jgi:hypothetical protein
MATKKRSKPKAEAKAKAKPRAAKVVKRKSPIVPKKAARKPRQTAEQKRRSESARKAYAARKARETAEKARRSEAARKGHITRKLREQVRDVLVVRAEAKIKSKANARRKKLNTGTKSKTKREAMLEQIVAQQKLELQRIEDKYDAAIEKLSRQELEEWVDDNHPPEMINRDGLLAKYWSEVRGWNEPDQIELFGRLFKAEANGRLHEMVMRIMRETELSAQDIYSFYLSP